MRIAVLRPQVPFARGGVEIFTDELVSELRARGHDADLVSVPFKWYPGARVLTQAFLWRMLDLGEAARLFATSANVAGRLERSTGLVAEVLPHPPQALPYHSGPSHGFVLSASRLDRAKRIDLLLEAAALEPGFDVVIASDGPDRDRLEELAHARGLDGRVRFEGRVDPEHLAELYATCSS